MRRVDSEGAILNQSLPQQTQQAPIAFDRYIAVQSRSIGRACNRSS